MKNFVRNKKIKDVFVDFRAVKSVLSIHYDATQIRYGDILEKIKEYGRGIPDSPWCKWKKGWIEFAETNMRENAKSFPV